MNWADNDVDDYPPPGHGESHGTDGDVLFRRPDRGLPLAHAITHLLDEADQRLQETARKLGIRPTESKDSVVRETEEEAA